MKRVVIFGGCGFLGSWIAGVLAIVLLRRSIVKSAKKHDHKIALMKEKRLSMAAVHPQNRDRRQDNDRRHQARARESPPWGDGWQGRSAPRHRSPIPRTTPKARWQRQC